MVIPANLYGILYVQHVLQDLGFFCLTARVLWENSDFRSTELWV